MRDSEYGKEIFELSAVEPFHSSVGKVIRFYEGGRSHDDSIDILRDLIALYLFEVGVCVWRPKVFSAVWASCVRHFDPSEKTVPCAAYVPLLGMQGLPSPGVGGKARSVDLGNGLELCRLSSCDMARLGNLSTELAGVTLHHRFTAWASHFLVKRWAAEKTVGEDLDTVIRRHRVWSGGFESLFNEEIALLRCLLGRRVIAPTYAVIHEEFSPQVGAGAGDRLPWRAGHDDLYDSWRLNSAGLRRYLQRRERFLKLAASPGWTNLAGSIRRYAIAWENAFKADILTDLVAALEALLVGDKIEVAYKLRVRAANFLHSVTRAPISTTLSDIRDAYDYRSRVAHGQFVFDNPRELALAQRVKGAKKLGKKQKDGHTNPFHDVNEIHRLTYSIDTIYRALVCWMLDQGTTEIKWEDCGL